MEEIGNFRFVETSIKDVYVIEPKKFGDERGYFMETYKKSVFDAAGLRYDFVQDNQSKSKKGVLRGLHFQKGEHAQAKLVRVVKGAVIDVVVDIRPESQFFGKYIFVYLSEENRRQLFVPRGFAHGFIAVQDGTVFQYKCDNFYCKESEGSIFYWDAEINFPWGIWANIEDMKVSDKDKNAPTFSDYKREINYNVENQ